MYTTKLKRISISLLLALMLLSSFSFSKPASADIVNDWTYCGSEGNFCSFTGPKEVRYGEFGTFDYKVVASDGINCSISTWLNDPVPGVRKHCDIRNVQLDSALTAIPSVDKKTVTVSFSVYAAPVSTLQALSDSITVKRSDASVYSALGANDTITWSNTSSTATLVVTFENALTGNTNSIHIGSGALLDSNNLPYNTAVSMDNIVGFDITPPAYIGSTSSNGNNVQLIFDENIIINSGTVTSDTYLKSKISIATDGVNFVPISAQSNVSSSNNYIYLSYYNDMKVILGTKTLIKIDKNTLKDAVGNLNAEMILHVAPPVIQSVQISSDNHDVTITFNESVVDNTYSGGSSNLRNYISLIYGANSNLKYLVEGDTANVVLGKLKIHFAQALSGTSNQIKITGGSIKDGYGNVLSEDRLTSLIQANVGAVDSAPPNYVNTYYSNSFKDANLVFDEDVMIASDDLAAFKNNIRWYDSTYGYKNGLPSDASVTVAGHLVTIHFETYPGTVRYYRLDSANLISDLAGNHYTSSRINTDWVNTTLTTFGITRWNPPYLSHDGRWLTISFNNNYDLVDNSPIVGGESTLRELITISTNHGVTFSALNILDIVSIQGNRINVFLHDGIKAGEIELKIAANALSDLHGYQKNIAIDQVIAYNTPDITGYVLSNTASEFVFPDNETWRNDVKVIRIYDNNIETDRQLNNSEYSLTAGKLTINNGVFLAGHYYNITIDADGYSSKYFEGRAYKSSEIFYMTAPVVTAENGITAKINLFNKADADESYYYYYNYIHALMGTQTVVFELMKGSSPVSIVASNLRLIDGTYTANFNVPYDNTYTVRAYVVSKYNNDPSTVGVNLATVKTQNEIDQAINAVLNNNSMF